MAPARALKSSLACQGTGRVADLFDGLEPESYSTNKDYDEHNCSGPCLGNTIVVFYQCPHCCYCLRIEGQFPSSSFDIHYPEGI